MFQEGWFQLEVIAHAVLAMLGRHRSARRSCFKLLQQRHRRGVPEPGCRARFGHELRVLPTGVS